MTRSPRTSAPLPRGLTHPLFYAALLLLAVNDHVLKGSGQLPGWLTGKLSDFAGLLVAPVVLAVLLGASKTVTRWVAPALVGAGFSLIKLDAGAARAVEQALAPLMHARIWVDASDLWALLVLPIAAFLCVPAPLAVARATRSRRAALARVGLAVAACFCVASLGSSKDDDESTGSGPQLINDTDDDLIVSIASTEGAGGCRIYRADRASLLVPDAFATRRELRLGVGGRVGLSEGGSGECGAAWISLADGSAVRVLWNDLQPLDDFVSDDSEEREARRVVVRGQRNTYRFELGAALRELVASDSLPDPTCVRRTATHSVEYTSTAAPPGFLELGPVERDEAGCLVVEWRALQGEEQTDMQRLCVPDWAFPFEPGETLAVFDADLEDGERRLRVTRYDGARAKLTLTIWNDALELLESRVVNVSAADCVGELLECGGYVRPVEVTLVGDEGTVVAGEEAALSDGSDEVRLLVGSARDVAWAGASCAPEDSLLGSRVNLLELRTD